MKKKNTIQRKFNKQLWLLRFLVKTIPLFGKRYVLSLFFTPIKYPVPEHEGLFKHGSIISREYVDNKRITAYHIGQSTKNVLLVHGWSGRASQFYKIAPALVNAGYKVFAFTAPAHGSSTDKTTHMLEFAECIAYLSHKYGPFEAILGHSLGGMATLNAIKYGTLAKKAILIGTPGYITDVVNDFVSKLSLEQNVATYIIEHLKAEYDIDFEKFSSVRVAEQMTIPGLIIHDVNDKDVSIEAARTVHKAWKTSEFLETKGLGHRFILQDEAVIKRIIDFIKK